MQFLKNHPTAGRWAVALGLAVAIVLVTTAAGLASDAGHGGGHSGGGGLPQLNTHTFMPQLVWLGVCFVVLYLLMSQVALPQVVEVIETRDGKIAYDLSQAEQLKNELALLVAAVEKQLSEARGQAQGLLARAGEEVSGHTQVALAEIDADILGRVKDAEIRIVAAKQKVIDDLQNVATGVAIDVVGRLVGGADRQVVAAAVARVIEERA